MAALDTVEKIVAQARILLQDTIEPYRYPTAQLWDSLNMALLDARRLRPDMFLGTTFTAPFFTLTDPPALETPIVFDQQYRLALVYFIVGQSHLRDEEDVQDARASAFMQKFTSMLVDPISPGIR